VAVRGARDRIRGARDRAAGSGRVSPPHLQRAVTSGADDSLGFWLVGIFTVGGVLLALSTIALVAVQA
jgi:hypothetical protein